MIWIAHYNLSPYLGVFRVLKTPDSKTSTKYYSDFFPLSLPTTPFLSKESSGSFDLSVCCFWNLTTIGKSRPVAFLNVSFPTFVCFKICLRLWVGLRQFQNFLRSDTPNPPDQPCLRSCAARGVGTGTYNVHVSYEHRLLTGLQFTTTVTHLILSHAGHIGQILLAQSRVPPAPWLDSPASRCYCRVVGDKFPPMNEIIAADRWMVDPAP